MDGRGVVPKAFGYVFGKACRIAACSAAVMRAEWRSALPLTCASCIEVCSIPLSCSSSSSLLCRCHACRMAADSAAMCVASCV